MQGCVRMGAYGLWTVRVGLRVRTCMSYLQPSCACVLDLRARGLRFCIYVRRRLHVCVFGCSCRVYVQVFFLVSDEHVGAMCVCN